jgi:Putative glycolipid-binding
VLSRDEVHCDEKWRTQRVRVERTIGRDVKTLSLTVENNGAWACSGRELDNLKSCEDVDLENEKRLEEASQSSNCVTVHRDDLVRLHLAALDCPRFRKVSALSAPQHRPDSRRREIWHHPFVSECSRISRPPARRMGIKNIAGIAEATSFRTYETEHQVTFHAVSGKNWT